MKKILPIISLFFLFSCSRDNPNIVLDFPKDKNLERKEHAGNMFGNKDGIVLFKGEKIENKSSLWKKSIEVISELFPITIADENSGLIATDWSNIKSVSGNNDLYKLNLVVTGRKFERENIKISVFKQTENDSKEEITEKIIDLIFADIE